METSECLVQAGPRQLHEVPAITVLLVKATAINFISAGSFIRILYMLCRPSMELLSKYLSDKGPHC